VNQDLAAALPLISEGQLSVEGRLVDASNATFYCAVSLDGTEAACVYKPVRGERPLWDFPGGSLARREVATYALSVATGWNLVPPTVFRDGPFGAGMCQLWIEHDLDRRAVDIVPCDEVPDGWHVVLDAVDAEGDEVSLVHSDELALRRLALFDVLVNNADRKGGHVLYGPSGGSLGGLFGVDHGLCFHVDDKLRTVLWGWAGQPIDEESLDTLAKLDAELDGALGQRLGELIEADEIAALRRRLAGLRRSASYPLPGDGWPAIPWPVF
jgi:uncharacterized repeat protein (TIGR03843 family)